MVLKLEWHQNRPVKDFWAPPESLIQQVWGEGEKNLYF